MKKNNFATLLPWSLILTIIVFIYAFIIPVLPLVWGKVPAKLGISLIIIAGILSIDKVKNAMLILFFGTLLLQWVSSFYEIWIFVYISKFLNILFFLIVVYKLIAQIATAKVVTLKEIMESISGYILIGIVFSIMISFIIQTDPGAYNIPPGQIVAQAANLNISTSMYYGYITLASLGYGDIVPLKPYTRSLATFISISGQFYIAILISLLVGKFASGGDKS